MRWYWVLCATIAMGACSRPIEPVAVEEKPVFEVNATQPVVRGIPSQEVVRLPMSIADQAKWFEGTKIWPQDGSLTVQDLGADGAYRKLLVRSELSVRDENPIPMADTVSTSIGFSLLRGDSSVADIRLTVPLKPALNVQMANTSIRGSRTKADIKWVEAAGTPLVVDHSEGIQTEMVPIGANHAKLLIQISKHPTSTAFIVLESSKTHAVKLVSFSVGGSDHPSGSTYNCEPRNSRLYKFSRISSRPVSTPDQIRLNPASRYQVVSIAKSGKTETVTLRSTTAEIKPVVMDVLGHSGVLYSQLYVPNLNR